MATMTSSVIPQSTSASGRLLLTGIRWQTYEALLDEIKDRSIRLTYDRGALEIMAPTLYHERCKRQLGMVVETLADELELPRVSCGSATFRQEDLARGLEPDDCFYLANAPRILGKTRLDLSVDPPPDLVIEIDVTASMINRLETYAALKVPEIWRFNGTRLQVFQLQPDGSYVEVKSSPTFPALGLDRLAEFLVENQGLDDGSLVRVFRLWLRKFGFVC